MVSSTTALGLTLLTLVALALAGTWHARGRIESIEDYITARGSVGGGALTATVVASSMGAWILLSPAQAGATSGGLTAIVGYAVGAALAVGGYAVVGPRIRSLIPEGHSLTEYALARYGRAMYAYVLVVSVLYMFVFLGAELTGISEALSIVAGVPRGLTATLVGVFVLAYTAYGGLRASIATDALQTVVILPLLVVSVVGVLIALGGPGAVGRSVASATPHLLDPGYLPGIEFGIYVVVAEVGAELLNQAWWQRVYAARSDRTLRRAFSLAAGVVFAMVLVSGAFGLVADARGLVGGPADASVAFFLVITDAVPGWVAFAVVLLALLLVTSSADTLFNAIASVVTADLPRLLDDPSDRTLTAGARLLTVVVAACAVLVAVRVQSVLLLFLTADLLAAATFVPLLAGLYTERLGGRGALVASLVAVAGGAVWFPGVGGVIRTGVLPQPSYFVSFLVALGASVGLTALATTVDEGFDLDSLSRTIRRFDAPERTEPDGGTVGAGPPGDGER